MQTISDYFIQKNIRTNQNHMHSLKCCHITKYILNSNKNQHTFMVSTQY